MTVYDSFIQLTLSCPWLDSQACRWGTAALNWTSRFIGNVWCTKNKFWKARRFKLSAQGAKKLSKCFWFFRMIRFRYLMLVDICCCWVFFWYCNFAFLHTKPWRWNSAKRFGESWQNKIQTEHDQQGFWVAQGLLIRKILHQLRGLQHCNWLSISSTQYRSYSVLQHPFYWLW